MRTPLGAVVAGLLAGVVGTACMDTVRYLQYRRSGGGDKPLEWEFPRVDSWADAPAPGVVVKRLAEGFTQREIPDRFANLVSTIAHWGYGSGWAALYGILAGSLRRPHPFCGLPFGVAVWAGAYAALPQAGLYKQIWEYDAETLAKDLGAHLAYGLGTGIAFRAFSRYL